MPFAWTVSESCSVRVRSEPTVESLEKGFLQEGDEVMELDRHEDAYGQMWIQHKAGWSVIFSNTDEGAPETFLTPLATQGEKIVWQVGQDKMVRIRDGPGKGCNVVGSVSGNNNFVELKRQMVYSDGGRTSNELWLQHKKGWSVFACVSDDGIPTIFVLPVGVEEAGRGARRDGSQRGDPAPPAKHSHRHAAAPALPNQGPPSHTPAPATGSAPETKAKDDSCTICFEPFLNKWALVPCGHVMCDCSEDYLKSHKTCPFCRDPITSRMKIFC